MMASDLPGRDDLDERRRGQVAEAVLAGHVVDDAELARAGWQTARVVKRWNAAMGVGMVGVGVVLGLFIPFDEVRWEVMLVTTGLAALIGGGFVVPYQKGAAAERANHALLEGQPVPTVVAPSRGVRVVAAAYVLVIAAFGVFWAAQALIEVAGMLDVDVPVLAGAATRVAYLGTVGVVWLFGARALIRALHRRPGRDLPHG